MRHIAPAGAPIRVADLARWAGVLLSRSDALESLQHAFQRRFGVRHSFVTSTGRAGMTLVLQAMARLCPRRDEVIVPSYTCYSVAASIVKAGLRPRIVDISPDTLDYAPDALGNADCSRVLAIVATNLYGLPNDLPTLSAFARRQGAFLIDDAAQAMGAKVGGRWSGTWGDAGLFSLDKGKNVSAIDGGIVVTNSNDVALAMREQMANVHEPGMRESGAGVIKAIAYFVMLRPWLYWIPNRIPQLALGKTVFTTDFPLERPSRALAALGTVMSRHLDEFTNGRISTASLLRSSVKPLPGVRTITPTAGAVPVYLRFPILLGGRDARRRALDALNAAGIGATGSYPGSIADIDELRGKLADPAANAAGGRYVADHIVTLPTHAFVTAADVSRAVSALARETLDVPAALSAMV